MTNILTYSMPPQQKPARQLRTNTRKYARLEKCPRFNVGKIHFFNESQILIALNDSFLISKLHKTVRF